MTGGHRAALELLIALSDKGASCASGWLFEYVYDEALWKEPVLKNAGILRAPTALTRHLPSKKRRQD